jgi:hypothetical protein
MTVLVGRDVLTETKSYMRDYSLDPFKNCIPLINVAGDRFFSHDTFTVAIVLEKYVEETDIFVSSWSNANSQSQNAACRFFTSLIIRYIAQS